eukprot:7030011-Heterocapsa_arctica.AAC.1
MAAREAQNKQEEKEEVNNMMEHRSSENNAPWITGMTEAHMTGIVRWMRTMKETDPAFTGTVQDGTILEMEEI